MSLFKFRKRIFVFNNTNRVKFEKFMIQCLENRKAWESGENRITFPGMPSYQIITIKETDKNLVFAHFSDMVKMKDHKGNTYHLAGNDGVYESFMSFFNEKYIKELLDKQSSNLN